MISSFLPMHMQPPSVQVAHTGGLVNQPFPTRPYDYMRNSNYGQSLTTYPRVDSIGQPRYDDHLRPRSSFPTYDTIGQLRNIF